MFWKALFEYLTLQSNNSDWKKITAEFEEIWNMLAALEPLMRSILWWKSLYSLVSYDIITHSFSALFCFQYALQFCSNKCWTIWEQQWFWCFVKLENGKKVLKSFLLCSCSRRRCMTLLSKREFFLLVMKSSHWSIGSCDHMPVNNWQIKQEKCLPTSCHELAEL